MKSAVVIGLAVLLGAGSASAHKSAGSDRMKVCADQWKARPQDRKSDASAYRAFIRDCMRPQPAMSPKPAEPGPAALAQPHG